MSENFYEEIEEEVVEESMGLRGTIVRRRKRIVDSYEGVRIVDRKEVSIAACGHVVRSSQDVGGKCCVCGRIVCRNCLRICERCLKPVCPKHTKVYEGKFYCSSCHWKVALMELFLGPSNGHESDGRSVFSRVKDLRRDAGISIPSRD